MLYEDKLIALQTPEQPATKGHVQIHAIVPFDSLSADDFAHILSAATFTSSTLFEQVGAHGSNIIFSDTEGVVVDIVARTEQDGLVLRWDALQVPEDEMGQLTSKIKNACDYIGVEQPKVPIPSSEPQPPASEQEEPEPSKSVENYLLKKLNRLP